MTSSTSIVPPLKSAMAASSAASSRRRFAAAGAADREMRRVAAGLAAEAERLERLFDRRLAGRSFRRAPALPRARACAGGRAIGNAPAPRICRSNGSCSRAASATAAQISPVSRSFDVAEELQRPVEALRLDPFHVRRDGRELLGDGERACADVVGNRDGDEGADFHMARSAEADEQRSRCCQRKSL